MEGAVPVRRDAGRNSTISAHSPAPFSALRSASALTASARQPRPLLQTEFFEEWGLLDENNYTIVTRAEATETPSGQSIPRERLSAFQQRNFDAEQGGINEAKREGSLLNALDVAQGADVATCRRGGELYYQ